MRRLQVIGISTLLVVLGACGTGGGALDEIEVSKAATPKVKVPTGTETTKTTTKVIEEGSGEEVAAGDSIKLNYVALNGRTGKQFDSSYAAGTPSTFTLDDKSVLPGFIKSLKGQKVGSRILALVPPKDGFNAAQESFDLKKDDTMVFVFDIVAKLPTQAEGEAKKLSKSLPKLELNDKGQPTKFVQTDDTKKKQTKASAHVVIQGTGDKIKKDQSVSVQYVGQVYPAGKIFDASWSRGAPANFALTEGQLIKCWTDLLVGQRVGSRVVLVCPSDTAYGKDGRAPDIKGGDTLIFAIDLLDAS